MEDAMSSVVIAYSRIPIFDPSSSVANSRFHPSKRSKCASGIYINLKIYLNIKYIYINLKIYLNIKYIYIHLKIYLNIKYF